MKRTARANGQPRDTSGNGRKRLVWWPDCTPYTWLSAKFWGCVMAGGATGMALLAIGGIFLAVYVIPLNLFHRDLWTSVAAGGMISLPILSISLVLLWYVWRAFRAARRLASVRLIGFENAADVPLRESLLRSAQASTANVLVRAANPSGAGTNLLRANLDRAD